MKAFKTSIVMVYIYIYIVVEHRYNEEGWVTFFSVLM